ncbi:hemolysin [Pseudoclavibacter endophyticus]|uniref:TlyA family RNA methyltransferase n=1 Tax=Pseudoclavibacter endophyticus TaxID=1778590 RepID=A0A6H9WU76_9MICO|nr:TlyA family RNA methyltransferase [Pseudoclavibacter endophyticus]KAB1650417.1 TlyA family RNA methyltransferase [Pseudoclavibacter endophyticus]GGA54294.1 hemolysin [Pseudoclavibacter endophyticus]
MPGDTTGASRLDQALAGRGLARSRTHAARLIELGAVTVNGAVATKPSLRVTEGDTIEVRAEHPEHRYVSRAALKLVAALDEFGIDPRGRASLDVGASTGGFTQVLLERGARHVIALDVGHGQLAEPLAGHPDLTLLEGVNARDLTRDGLDGMLRGSGSESQEAEADDGAGPRTPRAGELDLVVADLSFISLRHVLGPLRRTAGEDADFVVLIKPQFEVGRQGVRDGIVADQRLVGGAVSGVVQQAFEANLGTLGIMASPIAGTHGNREFLAHFAARGEHPTQWTDRIREVTGDTTRGEPT